MGDLLNEFGQRENLRHVEESLKHQPKGPAVNIDTLKKEQPSRQVDENVGGQTTTCEITDFDIATIEALHDLLLDKHGYKLDHITLTSARKLTAKMYDAFKSA